MRNDVRAFRQVRRRVCWAGALGGGGGMVSCDFKIDRSGYLSEVTECSELKRSGLGPSTSKESRMTGIWIEGLNRGGSI